MLNAAYDASRARVLRLLDWDFGFRFCDAVSLINYLLVFIPFQIRVLDSFAHSGT